jgi:hypothetical protein
MSVDSSGTQSGNSLIFPFWISLALAFELVPRVAVTVALDSTMCTEGCLPLVGHVMGFRMKISSERDSPAFDLSSFLTSRTDVYT